MVVGSEHEVEAGEHGTEVFVICAMGCSVVPAVEIGGGENVADGLFEFKVDIGVGEKIIECED